MKPWMDRHPRCALSGGLMAWFLFAFLFIARSPAGAFSHDFRGHVQFTQILYSERRIPLPREGWETYQPPLYYLINTLFSPERPSHTFQIRLMSALYGILTLLLITRLLARYAILPSAQLIVLAFVASAPSFIFMFTTYNNDSLATLLSVAILVTAHAWILEGRRRSVIFLGVLILAGLYTKLTVVFPLAALCMILGLLGLFRKLPWKRIVPVFGAVGLGTLLLSPWLLGHNYRHTGLLTPTPADFPVDSRVRLPQTALRTVLTPPLWNSQEWKDPFAHLWGEAHHKKNSYLSYLFVTSIFDEYTFASLPPALPWAIVFLHGILLITALGRANSSAIGRLCLGFIVLGIVFLTSLIFRSPYASYMDFRYIAWLWLPGALLYATHLVFAQPRTSPFGLSSLFRALFVSGAVLQGLFWFALVVGGRWNIP